MLLDLKELIFMTKTCTLCKRTLPVDSFYVQNSYRGVQIASRCKECIKNKTPLSIYIVYNKAKATRSGMSASVRERFDKIAKLYPLRIVDGSGSIQMWDWLRKPLKTREFVELAKWEEKMGIVPIVYYQYEAEPRCWPPTLEDIQVDYKLHKL